MERGATSTLVFTFPDAVDFTEIAAIELLVVGAESKVKLTKSGGAVKLLADNRAGVFFTQEETLHFRNDEDLRLQWHWRNHNGTARVSRIIETNLYEFLGSEAI